MAVLHVDSANAQVHALFHSKPPYSGARIPAACRQIALLRPNPPYAWINPVRPMNWEKYREKMEPVGRWVEDARRAGGDPNVARAIEARLESEADEEIRRSLDLELAGIY